MTEVAHLDGNAMGGLLMELFHQEMTNRLGQCRNCGSINHIGEARVYSQSPGLVMRCPACESVLLVVVAQTAGYRVNFEALRWIEIDYQEGGGH